MKTEKKFSEFHFEVKALADNGTFEGYGSVFGNEDFGGDIVVKGAFVKSIAELQARGRKLPILWQHNSNEPLGVYEELKEDDHGLFVRGRMLVAEVAKAREGHALMKAGAVTGLSIGYSVNRYEVDEEAGTRKLTELDLWEISQVTFPMNDAARIEAVKKIVRDGDLPSLKDFEGFLRESGFSKSQACAIAGKGLRDLLRSESVAETEAKNTAEMLTSFKLPTFEELKHAASNGSRD